MEIIDLIGIARAYNDKVTEEIASGGEFIVKYTNAQGVYTGYFRETMGSILLENGIKKYDGINYSGDQLYYEIEKLTIDMVVWKARFAAYNRGIDKDELNFRLSGNIWKYILLIEHENSGPTWLHEMQKVASVDAPYKLIITYGRSTAKGVKGASLLKHANAVMQYIRQYNFEDFIIMFGEEIKNIKKLGDKKVFDIYRFNKDSEKFELIE